MNLGISGRVERAIRIAVGTYFGLAALSDLQGSVLVLPGIAPLESSRSLQLFTGCVVLACAVLLFRRKLARFGAIGLGVAYTLRSLWDLTGGQTWSVAWTLLLGGLSIIVAWRPEEPDKSGDGNEESSHRKLLS